MSTSGMGRPIMCRTTSSAASATAKSPILHILGCFSCLQFETNTERNRYFLLYVEFFYRATLCRARNIAKARFYHLIGPSFQFFVIKGPCGNLGLHPQRGRQIQGMQQFSTNMRLYLGNGVSDLLHVWFQVMVFGVSRSNGARPICGSTKSKTVAGGHLGMMAQSRITVASAGLSCCLFVCL